ncbi:hypothetical protein RI367_008720 [Sorochytrium milnesiophthora]
MPSRERLAELLPQLQACPSAQDAAAQYPDGAATIDTVLNQRTVAGDEETTELLLECVQAFAKYYPSTQSNRKDELLAKEQTWCINRVRACLVPHVPVGDDTAEQIAMLCGASGVDFHAAIVQECAEAVKECERHQHKGPEAYCRYLAESWQAVTAAGAIELSVICDLTQRHAQVAREQQWSDANLQRIPHTALRRLIHMTMDQSPCTDQLERVISLYHASPAEEEKKLLWTFLLLTPRWIRAAIESGQGTALLAVVTRRPCFLMAHTALKSARGR